MLLKEYNQLWEGVMKRSYCNSMSNKSVLFLLHNHNLQKITIKEQIILSSPRILAFHVVKRPRFQLALVIAPISSRSLIFT